MATDKKPNAPDARSKSQLRRFDALGVTNFTCEFCGAVRDIAAVLRPEAAAPAPLTGVEFLQTWMRTANPMLGDAVPLDMLKKGQGARLALFIEAAYEASQSPDST